jgi:signal transduction histidine kinase
LQIAASDNGKGFDPEKLQAADNRKARVGHGLPGLKARLESLTGECQIRSALGEGTSIILRIPLVASKVHL